MRFFCKTSANFLNRVNFVITHHVPMYFRASPKVHYVTPRYHKRNEFVMERTTKIFNLIKKNIQNSERFTRSQIRMRDIFKVDVKWRPVWNFPFDFPFWVKFTNIRARMWAHQSCKSLAKKVVPACYSRKMSYPFAWSINS